MNFKKITKLSIDNQKFHNIKGILDTNCRVLKFQIHFNMFESIFNFSLSELYSQKKSINSYKAIYVMDEDDVEYSCFNCIFGFTVDEYLKFYTVSIDCILENILTDFLNIDLEQLTIVTSFPIKYYSYINNIELKYTKTKYLFVKSQLKKDKLIVEYSIISSNKTRYEQLSNILYSLLELTFLCLGDMPKIEMIKIFEDKEIILHNAIAPKYIQRDNIYNSTTNGILAYIESQNITSHLIKKFIKFRKQTKILFDLLMIHVNGHEYLEIKNSMLVQLLEGLYRTTNHDSTKELWEILKIYYLQNETIRSLLTKRDLNDAHDVHHTPIFLLKTKEHRHYLSHLNMNEEKKAFYKLENNYAYWKLCLCIRIYIMQLLEISINIDELEITKNSIETWAKNHHLRYKK